MNPVIHQGLARLFCEIPEALEGARIILYKNNLRVYNLPE